MSAECTGKSSVPDGAAPEATPYRTPWWMWVVAAILLGIVMALSWAMKPSREAVARKLESRAKARARIQEILERDPSKPVTTAPAPHLETPAGKP